jgi:predicted ATP-dependent serine protease
MIYVLWILSAILAAQRASGFVIASIPEESKVYSLDTSVLEGGALSATTFASALAAGDAGIGKSTALNALALHFDSAGTKSPVFVL